MVILFSTNHLSFCPGIIKTGCTFRSTLDTRLRNHTSGETAYFIAPSFEIFVFLLFFVVFLSPPISRRRSSLRSPLPSLLRLCAHRGVPPFSWALSIPSLTATILFLCCELSTVTSPLPRALRAGTRAAMAQGLEMGLGREALSRRLQGTRVSASKRDEAGVLVKGCLWRLKRRTRRMSVSQRVISLGTCGKMPVEASTIVSLRMRACLLSPFLGDFHLLCFV